MEYAAKTTAIQWIHQYVSIELDTRAHQHVLLCPVLLCPYCLLSMLCSCVHAGVLYFFSTMSVPQDLLIKNPSELMIIKPLGAGQEVGRSCIYVEYKEKKILLDFGIHPGLSGRASLPFIDQVDVSAIDLLLVSHFHLDHCGALPWLLEKTSFTGRCFMTHATKAIYKWLLSDFIRISTNQSEEILFGEQDLENSMTKIDTINFHQELEVNGIKFWCYHAGHVLGAAMFAIEIDGTQILYTGDFSREEDRHLMSAEIPMIKPSVLIVESTYGTHVHEDQHSREKRFTTLIRDIVTRGGRCLIPVFALGRAQELLLILDEYWSENSDIRHIPIYYASSLAKKCMTVYQTYINAMNETIRNQYAVNNPFNFRHISYLKGTDDFEDVGPCVVLASPGMMQSGISRELFETWCSDSRNGVIIAGYCVEGTLAKSILNEPADIISMKGQKLPLRCSVDYISFSAHTDYKQTSEFIRLVKPDHVVLVHGETTEMLRLKSALQREYEHRSTKHKLKVYSPKNTQEVQLHFSADVSVKILGKMATQISSQLEDKSQTSNPILSGILVKRDFKQCIVSPDDLSTYTELSTSILTQRLIMPFTANLKTLVLNLSQVAGGELDTLQEANRPGISLFKSINVFLEHKTIILEWTSGPLNDMYADSVIAVILKTESGDSPGYSADTALQVDRDHFNCCLRETLQEMYGEVKQLDERLVIITDGKVVANIDLGKLTVNCEDSTLKQNIETTIHHIFTSVLPIRFFCDECPQSHRSFRCESQRITGSAAKWFFLQIIKRKQSSMKPLFFSEKQLTEMAKRNNSKDDINRYSCKRHSNLRRSPNAIQISKNDNVTYEWGKTEVIKSETAKPQKVDGVELKPSGNLLKDTNMYRGFVIKYSQPPEARKPHKRWRLYPFKADIPIDHPSCSLQHAVLQYRSIEYSRADQSTSRRILPYVLDLNSTNGTHLNGKLIEPQRFYELRDKDVIRFGFSSREYVLLHENSSHDVMDELSPKSNVIDNDN
ncbi:hypothetical protein GJ496_009958 [Pomphorhynchus laevis]|nr:hypothetical protein GJ496_009958 [Pomphorhynchus laevis]